MKMTHWIGAAAVAATLSLPAQAHEQVSAQLNIFHGPLSLGLLLGGHHVRHGAHRQRDHGAYCDHREHRSRHRSWSGRHDHRHHHPHYAHSGRGPGYRGADHPNDHRGHGARRSHRHTDVCYRQYSRNHSHWR